MRNRTPLNPPYKIGGKRDYEQGGVFRSVEGGASILMMQPTSINRLPGGFPPSPPGLFTGEQMKSEKEPLPCGECKYAGFRGLVWTCRHPQINKPINGPLMMKLAVNGKCEHFVDIDKKILPGRQQDWLEPVKG